MSGLVDRGRDSYERARQAVNRGVDEVRRYGAGAANRATQFASEAAEAVEDVAARRS